MVAIGLGSLVLAHEPEPFGVEQDLLLFRCGPYLSEYVADRYYRGVQR